MKMKCPRRPSRALWVLVCVAAGLSGCGYSTTSRTARDINPNTRTRDDAVEECVREITERILNLTVQDW
jgi:hypothetical protein